MGASAEVAKTLSGQLFILRDAWTDLLREMGEKSEGVFVNVIKWITDIADSLALIVNPTSPLEHATIAFDKFTDSIKDLDKEAKAAAIVEYINELKTKLDNAGESLTEVTGKIKSPWLLLSNQAILANDALKDEAAFLEKLRSSYRELIPMLNKYLDEVWSENDIVPKANDAIKTQARTINIVTAELAKWKEKLGDLSGKELAEANLAIYNLTEELKELAKVGLETPDIITKNMESIRGLVTSINEIRYPDTTELKKHGEEDLKITEETLSEKYDKYFAFADQVKGIYDSITEMSLQNMNAELKAAEGNEKKQEEIRRKYAIRRQLAAVGQAIMSGALGIMNITEKWASNPPVEAALIALQAITTALQLASIKAQKFATGILDLQGRGTGTSDSIPSMLSRGESVMTAKETKEYYPYLKAMKEGKFPKLQMELMNDFAKLQGVTNNNLNYDNSKEIKELRQIRMILNKERGDEYIDGKYRIIRKNGITTKISLN
jgi:hypothetical protein